jgi:hypothetical protein
VPDAHRTSASHQAQEGRRGLFCDLPRQAPSRAFKEPEFDAARALLAKGITGKLTLLDGKTGKPRIVIDIEQLAHLTVEEGPNGPRFVKYRQTVVDRSPTAETDEGEGEGKGGLKLQARNR